MRKPRTASLVVLSLLVMSPAAADRGAVAGFRVASPADVAALPAKDAAVHRAYLAVQASGAYVGDGAPDDRDAPVYVYERLRLGLLPDVELVLAGGSTDGGHRFLTSRVLVSTGGRVEHAEARITPGDERRVVRDLAVCPLSFLKERAAAFEGQPDLERLHALEAARCRRLGGELAAAVLRRRDEAGVRELVRLLAVVAEGGFGATLVERAADAPDGKLRDLVTRGPGPWGTWEGGVTAPTLVPLRIVRGPGGLTATGFIAQNVLPGWQLGAFTLEASAAGLTFELRTLGYTRVIIE